MTRAARRRRPLAVAPPAGELDGEPRRRRLIGVAPRGQRPKYPGSCVFRRIPRSQRRYEEAIGGCLKALESTLKIICHRRGWQFDGEKHTAKALIEIVFEKGLIPDYLQSQFGALRSALESGVPTIRNRAGGHGAGVKRREVPGYLASYTLHLTAAAILFLAEAEAALN